MIHAAVRRHACLAAALLTVASLTVGSLLASAAPAAAQSILVRVRGGEPAAPLQGALVRLLDGDGGPLLTRLSDAMGRALFVGVPPGRYGLRAEMIGMATAEAGPFEAAAGQSVPVDIVMSSSAIVLEGLDVEADERCRVRPEDGLLVARVWDEARKALEAAAFTDAQEMYRYETMRYRQDLERGTMAVLDEERTRREGYMRTPFESRPAEDLAENGYVQDTDDGIYYYAPDAHVLLSDVFLDTHCFRLESGEGDSADLLGLRFEPTGGRRSVVDIAGTLWLDPETSQLRWLEFFYENVDPDVRSPDIGGYVEFQRLPDGAWIVPEWWIRMPRLAMRIDGQGMRRTFVDGFSQVGGLVLDVRAGGRTVAGRETGGIEGLVLDSLGVEPLAGARVGVIGSGQTVFTGPDGRFEIPGLTEGTYRLRVEHPSLAAFGYGPEPIEQAVYGGEMARLEIRMPSTGDALFELCRGEERPERSVVLAGTVRDATGDRPLPGAVVRLEWQAIRMRNEYTSDAEITGTEQHGLQRTTDGEGRYRFCAVPEEEQIALRAVLEGYDMDPDTLRFEAFTGGVAHDLILARVRR